MVSIPDRLLDLPFVEVLFADSQVVCLAKEVTKPFENRPSYVSKHAVSVVLAGKQRIADEEGQVIHLAPGDVGIIKKGIYTVTDLLPDEGGAFRSFHFYFAESVLDRILTFRTGKGSGIIEQAPLLSMHPGIDLSLFWQELKQWQARIPQLDGAFFEERIFGFFQLLASTQPAERLWDHLRGFQQLQPKGLLQFLEANYDKPFTIEDYAYLSGRSISTFRREFKTKFGQTPRRWIINRRLQKAQEYLQVNGYSVSQAALAVGYEHTSHFIAAYKKHFGHTPGQRGDLEQTQLS